MLGGIENLEGKAREDAIDRIKTRVTEHMCNKLGCIWVNPAEASFLFDNGKSARVTRDYVGNQDFGYTLYDEDGDELISGTNPYSIGWCLYVLGCENRR